MATHMPDAWGCSGFDTMLLNCTGYLLRFRTKLHIDDGLGKDGPISSHRWGLGLWRML